MKFLTVKLKNFLTYQEQTTFPLDNQGLVYIRGDNRVSQALDSNGVGKTAIIDAISWALYGETTDGRRFDEVANRFTTGPCIVEMEIQAKDGSKYIIQRGRRPTFCDLRGVKHKWESHQANEVIESLVGFGPRTFRNAVVFGQGIFDRFATADQASQLKMLDEIQGLDFKGALDRAKAWRDEWRGKELAINNAAVSAQEHEEVNREHLKQLLGGSEDFQAEKQRKIKSIRAEIELQKDQELELSNKLEQIKSDKSRLRLLKKELDEIEKVENRIMDLKQEIDGNRKTKTVMKNQYDELESRIQDIIRQGRCPTCKRPAKEGPLFRAGFETEMAPIEGVIQELEEEARKLKNRKDKFQDELVEAEKKLPRGVNRASLDHQVTTLERATATIYQSQVQHSYRVAQDGLTEKRKELDAVQSAQWGGEKVLNAARKQHEKLRLDMERLVDEIGTAKNTIQAAEYWVQAFGDRGIRNLMFDSVAAFLNTRVAYHLEMLTGGEAQLVVSATSTLKKGGEREKVSISAEWGYGAGTYKGGSGGQERRIDLALFAGLQDVAESMSANPFPMKAWDQPDDNLDSRGQEIFAHWVEQEARKRGTGLLITHSPELGAMVSPDQVWNIILDRHGSRLEIQ